MEPSQTLSNPLNENKPQAMEVLPPSARYIENVEARASQFINPKLWQSMVIMADTFIKSGAIPNGIKNAPQAIMVMQAGYEMGLQPVEALNSFAVINGKLTLYGDASIAQVIKHGHKVEFFDCDATKATCRITRKDDGRSMESIFTMEMAIKRGLANKEPYQKWPENMMKFKAFHMTAKFIVPEVNHGMPMLEEIEELDEQPAVTPTSETAKPPAKTKTAPAKQAPKPLDAVLIEPDPQPEEKPAKPPKATKEPEAEKPVEETKEPDDMKAARLIDAELNGTKLSNGDRMWLAAHQAKSQAV